MAKIFSIGSGNIYKFFEGFADQNQTLHILRPLMEKYDIEGYELTISSPEILNQKLSQENKEFLATRKHISFHFPFKPFIEKNEIIEQIMGKIAVWYHELHGSLIVVHPRQISNMETLFYYRKKYGVNLVLEIEDYKGIPYVEFTRMLDQCELPFVFDVGHAEFYDKNLMDDFIKKYGYRICQLHVNKVKNGKAHHHFHTEGMSQTLPLVKDFNVPFTIEESFENGDIQTLEREIKFLKNYFMGKL